MIDRQSEIQDDSRNQTSEGEAKRPIVRVEWNPTRLAYQGRFSVQLSGVTYQRQASMGREKEDQTWVLNSNSLHSFLGVVGSSEAMDFEYTFGGDRPFSWLIQGRCYADNPEDASEEAIELYDRLAGSLALLNRHYRFEPVLEEETAAEHMDWCTEMRPVGIRVPVRGERTIGFTAGVADTGSSWKEVIAAPFPLELSKNLLTAGSIACVSKAAMRLELSIEPIEISPEDLQVIREAWAWLTNGLPKGVNYTREMSMCMEDPSLMERVTKSLEGFLKRGRGQRMVCRVLSSQPANESLVRMIGRDLFHGERFHLGAHRVSETARSEKEITRTALDLGNCVADPGGLPPLFVSPQVLGESGVRQFHNALKLQPFAPGIVLGLVDDGANLRPVTFGAADRSRHAYILGSSGTGKSTLMYNMIMQDIAARRGVCLIDPHGDLFRNVIEAIPENRTDDVAVIDPSDFGYAVGMNFFETSGEYRAPQMNFVCNEWMRIFDRLYDLRQTGGPIFEQYMRNALLLVMDNDIPGATILDVTRIFEDKRFRRAMVDNCRNILVKDFWTSLAERGSGDQSLQNLAIYVTSKLNQFVQNALLRPILGQTQSTIDFRAFMDEGKIILVNLPKGLLGELDTNLLGMLLIGRIFSAAMTRSSCRVENRRPFYLYIDEFQNFVTDTIAFLLSESRKFNLNLVLANQNLSQLQANHGRHNVLDAVLANAANIILFRAGVMDGKALELLLKPDFEPQDLVNLPEFHAVGRLLINNRPSQPFVFQTLPREKQNLSLRAEKIIERSRARYAKQTSEVEVDILKRRQMFEESDELEQKKAKVLSAVSD